MNHELIIVLDFGSPYNQLIARRIRALKVFCQVLPSNTPIDTIRVKNPKGIVMLPKPNTLISETETKDVLALGIPVLDKIYWDSADIAEEKISILKDFLFNTCSVVADWDMKDYAYASIESLKENIGDRKVLCALSGGVDSTVSAFMVHKAVGNNLSCVFVDTGLMRLDEGDEVEQAFKQFNINFIRVNASDRFLSKLAGVTDPEQKRKIIGEEFIRVFEDESRKIGAVDFLVQGTIYPDIIESGTNNSANIKSHHNVGGLPDVIDFKELVEPLKDLFKDEVRQVGLALGIPESLIFRQPFPGPGLAVRCIGEVTKEKLDILRLTDFILRDEIKQAGLDRAIWQYFTILTGLRSVGVKNEKRTYGYTVAIRAINTVDAMTADWIRIPYEILEKISTRIVAEVDEVNRIVYDITPKPPATIEWE